MTRAGFYEQKSFRPGGLALVIGLHAAAFAGLILVKTTIDHVRPPIIDLIDVHTPRPPDPPPPEPQREQPRQLPTQIDTVRPIVDMNPVGPQVIERDLPDLPPIPDIGERIELAGTPDLPPPPPVRVEAQLDPRYAADLQPPYPPSELSSERDGTVRVRVTIGADGRVKALQRMSATSDAFWRATERHAMARWRFRPATLDGRPVESTKVMNVHFRIEG